MCWTKDHDIILCREVANLNPYSTKKGSTMRSGIWEKIADNLNKCSVPKFSVDKRSVRDHVGNLVNKLKKKLRDEEKATGIAPDEPSELDNALDTIIALEESADAEVHEADTVRAKKVESERAKAESIRLKAMEKLSETRKRESAAGENEDDDFNNKRPRRRGSDAMVYLSKRAEINYELKQEEIKMKKEQQDFEKKQMEVNRQQQLQIQQQQNEILRMMQQQQQQRQQSQQQSQQQLMNSQMLMMQQQQEQTKVLMALLEKVINK